MERFPQRGTSWPELEAELTALRGNDPKLLGLRRPHEAEEVASAAHQLYFNVNAMPGPRFPSIWQITNELYALPSS